MQAEETIGSPKAPPAPPSLEVLGRRLLKRIGELEASAAQCAGRRQLGQALHETTQQDLLRAARRLRRTLRRLTGGAAALPPPSRPARLPQARQERERERAACEEREHQAPVAAAPVEPPDEAQLRALCQDYDPQPPPPRHLVVPPPPGFEESSPAHLPDAVVLGASGPSGQRGTLGRLYPGRLRVGLDLADSFYLATFSVPGGGKSYLLGVIMEMALQPLPGVSLLRQPLCGLSFHYHPGGGYEPAALSSVHPNQNAREALDLMEDLRALPRGLGDVVLIVPRGQVEAARRRHPHLRVFPLLFSPEELGTAGWEALLGINDQNDGTLYARRLRQELEGLRGALSLPALERRLGDAQLSEPARQIIAARLGFLRPYLAPRYPLARLLRPGRLIVVDLRDEWVPKKEALTLMALATGVLTQGAAAQGQRLLLGFDEAHRYMEHRVMRAELDRLVRERRHLGVSVMLASQDPLTVPAQLLSLADVLALGRIQSEEWLRRIGRANSALSFVKTKHTERLGQGRMIVWSERMHLEGVERGQLMAANPVQVRPQAAHPGPLHPRSA